MKSGKVWVGYYYNGSDGEIALGTDLNEAKRKWAELECTTPPAETGLMKIIFDRYEKEVLPGKAPRTQKDNLAELKQLRAVFNNAPVDAITPQHIAQYRDRRTAKVRANRELALLSHAFNMAREWGYTAKENPCRGVRKNRETPRDFYADKEVWDAVYEFAVQELRDAMDITYLTGQRNADALKMKWSNIHNGEIEVKQGKTGKYLRITLAESELGLKIEEIRSRSNKVRSMNIIATPNGVALTIGTLGHRFELARKLAAEKHAGTRLGEKIKKFQFRDIRPKAASEINDMEDARKLLGHSTQKLTKDVYRRIGEVVKPTK